MRGGPSARNNHPGKGATTNDQHTRRHVTAVEYAHVTDLDTLRFLTDLGKLDVPIWAATPGTGPGEIGRPNGWQTLTADTNRDRLRAWTEGQALSANMGGQVVVLDGDTRNGCDINAVETLLANIGVTVYATIATPSGGRHWYTPGGDGLPTTHATHDRPGFTGWPGLELISHGANVFLPGTKRPKYDGAGYRILHNNLAALAETSDPESASNLAAWVAAHRARQEETFTPAPPWEGTPPDRRQQAYLDGALQHMVNRISAMPPNSGRNIALHTAALACGNYIAGAGMDENVAIAALMGAAKACHLEAEDGTQQCLATIRSGIRYGATRPRAVPEPEHGTRVTEVDLSELGRLSEQGGHPEDDTGQPNDELDAWDPHHLGPYLDGTHTPPQPTLLPRTDGQHLLYPGKVHSMHGESESGKSMVAQAETARLLTAGRPVLYIDFESDPASIVDRLTTLGAPNHAILTHLTYITPDTSPLATQQSRDAWTRMLTREYDLAVIDGVTDALAVFGMKSNENDDLTTWLRVFPKRVAHRTGAAVVLIDHVIKDTENRGRFAIGGQAKLAGLTGAAYSVEIDSPLGRGLKGVIVLRIGKDRPGHIRGTCGPMRKQDRTQEAARITIDSTGHPDTIQVTVEPGRGNATDGPSHKPFRLTGAMERISRYVESLNTPASTRTIRDGAGVKAAHVQSALDTLTREGWVTVTDGLRGAQLHTVARPYRQHDDPQSDMFKPVDNVTEVPPERVVPVVPTGSRVVPGTGQTSGNHTPPPFRGGVAGNHSSGHPKQSHRFPDTQPVDNPPQVVCRSCGALDVTVIYPGRCNHCYNPVAGP